jgi:large repetitive protein
VQNPGTVPLVGTTGTISSSSPDVTFPSGSTFTLPDIPPYGSALATVEIALAEGIADIESIELTVQADNAEACETSVSKIEGAHLNVDDVPASSTIDTVESAAPSWEKGGDRAGAIWARAKTDPINHAWHGIDFSSESDTWIESPALQVNPADPFVITLQHRYSFQTAPPAGSSAATYQDGGVIEISGDGGTSWEDISTFIDPGYGGVLTNTSDNPLADRRALVATNPSWPAQDTLVLDLGTELAGRTVKIRFRIGTDDSSGEFGWEIDNFQVQGIDNRPFGSLVGDAAVCHAPPAPPVASAGPDQTVEEGEFVTLDATGSSDASNDPLAFTWTQMAGPRVMLEGASTLRPTFIAPDVDQETTLTFQVDVSDGLESTSDTVDIVVLPESGTGNTGSGGAGGTTGEGGSCGDEETPPEQPTPGSDDDSGCAVAGGPATTKTAPVAALLAMALFGLRRRRNGRAGA